MNDKDEKKMMKQKETQLNNTETWHEKITCILISNLFFYVTFSFDQTVFHDFGHRCGHWL